MESMAGDSLSVGSVFVDRYRIDERVGRGGMGTVYRVFDLVDQEERALKMLHENVTLKEGAERFLREIEILSHINHPSVPRVFSWGGKDTQMYFVAEFVRGYDLKARMKQQQRVWQPQEAADLIATLAEAVAEAHKLHIVHRDVKPQNVILCEDGSVKLLDFGVAHSRAGGMQTITKTGAILGTPEYMSPEQFKGEKVEPPSDVYSMGLILYQLLTGDLPFGGNKMEIAIRILTESVTPPRAIRNEIPVWLDHIVMKCLQRDMKSRYPTAAELAADLKKVRQPGKPKMTWLPGGDGVLDDPSGEWEWDLVLSTSHEKDGWLEGIGLRFAGILYRLQKISPPAESTRRWTYHFRYWPRAEVIRRLIDYESEQSTGL